MTFGTTKDKAWVEALPTGSGSEFTGRTFSRFHVIGDSSGATPTICEIWATSDHAVEAHAHDASELLYVLDGVIELNGRRLQANDVVFIPKGDAYNARVLSAGGSHVLRVAFPAGGGSNIEAAEPEYAAKVWTGPLTAEGYPELKAL